MSQNRNSLGTVWNSWQTTWSGVVDTKKETRNVYVGKGTRQNQTRTVNTVRSDRTRTGVTTKINLRIDKESQGHRTVSKVCLPYARSNSVSFVAENMKPKTRLYVFFNKTSVSAHVTPASSDYSSDSSPTAGSPLISDSVGKVEGTFLIPDPKVEGNIKFQTGDIQFTLTSSSKNAQITENTGLGTAAKETYSASGMLETKQETIIATRNASVVRTNVAETTSVNTTQASGWQNQGGAGMGNNWAGSPSHSPGGYQPSHSPHGHGGADGGGSAGAASGTWNCTATYNEGLITDSHFRTLNKLGIMLRRTDPNLMRGYDIWGPWLAKFVGKNDFTKSIGSAITDYYKNLYESKPLTLKQKIIIK